MSEWRVMTMSDVMVEFHDGPHATPPPADDGPIFLGIRNITESGRLDLSEVRHIAEEDFDRWTRRATPQPGDVVFTYEATLHRYALIPQGFRGCLGRRLALIRPDTSVVLPRYLHFAMLGPQWRATVADRVIAGSTVDRIPLIDFPTFPIALPDIETQSRVVEILGALDDLIENNRWRIGLLEQMAQAIYREWFVRFRYPGHGDDELVDSPLGPIPASWNVVKLGDFVEEIRNAAKPSAETSALAYVPIDSITPKSLTLREYRPGSEAASSLRLFRKGDILFGSMRAYFHKVCIAPFDGVTRSTVFVLRPDPGYYHYLALLLSDEATVSFAAAHSSGSTIPYAKWAGGLREMTALRPTPDLAERFGLGVAPMLEMGEVLAQSITTLTALRDRLLPKLVTGAIDASSVDLDALLEESAA